MNIVGVVGSLACGKSTLVETTARWLVNSGIISPGRIAYILNDRPTPEGDLVDGHSIRDIAQVITFPNRCFSCEDDTFLVDQLTRLHDSGDIDIVFVEGYGFVAGGETAEALEKTGFPFDIVSLIDSGNFAHNQTLYGDVIQSQVAAATLTVCITHVAGEEPDGEVLQFISSQAPAGVPAVMLRDGEPLPDNLISTLLESNRAGGCGDGHDCGHPHHDHAHAHGHGAEHGHHQHDHGHAHGHGGNHTGFASITYALVASATLPQLRSALSGQNLTRGKGVVQGQRFDILPGGQWVSGPRTDQDNLITAYSAGELITIPDELIDHEREASGAIGTTMQLLRQDVEDEEALERVLAELVSRIPAKPLIMPGIDGKKRVAVQLEELQLLKHAAQRPAVKDEWLLRVIKVALPYYVACAHYIAAHEDELDPRELPVSLQELGLALGWWTNRFELELDDELVAEVAACNVGEILQRGTVALGRLTANKQIAAAQSGYYLDVALFALRHGGNGADLDDLFEICIGYAETLGDEVVGAWRAAHAQLREQLA